MDNRIYPFANMETGDTFLYNFAPFMKIGARNIRGKYCEFEVNAVSLLTGQCIHLDKTDLVMIVENIWKGFQYHEEQGKFKAEKEENQKLRAARRCEDTLSEHQGDDEEL